MHFRRQVNREGFYPPYHVEASLSSLGPFQWHAFFAEKQKTHKMQNFLPMEQRLHFHFTDVVAIFQRVLRTRRVYIIYHNLVALPMRCHHFELDLYNYALPHCELIKTGFCEWQYNLCGRIIIMQKSALWAKNASKCCHWNGHGCLEDFHEEKSDKSMFSSAVNASFA